VVARSVARCAHTPRSGRHQESTMTMLLRLVREADGQDLIEYAFLTAFIGFAGAAAWNVMQTNLGNYYTSYITAAWNLWEPADPVGGGS
jgi:Flp pilus assembly pilin Flp